MLKQQSYGPQPQKISMNGVRLVRQAALTGEQICREDIVAMCGEISVQHTEIDVLEGAMREANHTIDGLRAERDRLRRVLAEWEQNQLAATCDAYDEGYHDGKAGREHRNTVEILAALDAEEAD